MPGATSSVLAPSSDALVYENTTFAFGKFQYEKGSFCLWKSRQAASGQRKWGSHVVTKGNK